MGQNFMDKDMSHKTFGEIDLNDVFFDSLKTDYPLFEDWFLSKREQDAYVQYNDKSKLEGFLYLKIEHNIVNDTKPQIKADKILKVGTFKINAHGSRLGERFIKIIMDEAIDKNVDLCYITIFPKHKSLINLVNKFGFVEYGEKGDASNPEKVFVKDMKNLTGNILHDYPLISTDRCNKYILGIYPRYHSHMFADSILNTENKSMLNDVSYTNSIHKIYVTSMDLKALKSNDILIIYRTADPNKSPEYSSVVTSIGVVEEIRSQYNFNSFDEFYNYSCQYSIFDREDLYKWYNSSRECKAIKFTYNTAFKKRITRHDLINTIGLSRYEYWGFFRISDKQFDDIIELSKINKQIIM